jgi:hypothetical protein
MYIMYTKAEIGYWLSLRFMCRYVAILVYQGNIENVSTSDDKNKSVAWIGELVREYGPNNCADSIIWDTQEETPIELAFAH